jgi:hypothetical protein
VLCDKVLQETLLVKGLIAQFRISDFIQLLLLTADTQTKLLHNSNKAHKSFRVYHKRTDTLIANSGSVHLESVKTWLFVCGLKLEN